MGTVIKELVTQGHELVALLGTQHGMHDAASLVQRLTAQLDITAVALREMTKKRDLEHGDVLTWEKTMFKVCGEDGHKSVAAKVAQLEAKCAALAEKGMEVVREASLVYSKYNDTQMPDRDIVDQQTLHELHELCKADDVGAAFLAAVRAQGGKVTLPTGYSVRPGHLINEAERGVMIPKDNGSWLSRHDVEHALRVVGIRINGEN